MTAQYPCSDRPGLTRTEVELSLRSCTLPQLEARLRAVQLRLGTPDEFLGDLECAQIIAHQINNVLTAQRLTETLRRLDET